MSLKDDYPRQKGESDEDWKARRKREYEIDSEYGISPDQRRQRAESERFNKLSFSEKFSEKPIEMLKQIGLGIIVVFIAIIAIKSCLFGE